MTTYDRPHEHDLPPPHGEHPPSPGESIPMQDGDVIIAWIVDRSLGFGGFGDERAAAAFAWAAHVVLSQWTAHEWHAAPPVAVTPRLEISSAAGAGARWVLADRLPIARLIDLRTVRPDHATAAMLVAIGRRQAAPRRHPTTRDPSTSALPADRVLAREVGVEPRAHVGLEIPMPSPAGALDLRSAARALCHALSGNGSRSRHPAARSDERGAAPIGTAERLDFVHAELWSVD
jgi:hypothetical protein